MGKVITLNEVRNERMNEVDMLYWISNICKLKEVMNMAMHTEKRKVYIVK